MDPRPERLELECRSLADLQASGDKISGYAVIFNSLSEDLGGFKELILPSAVDRSVTPGADIRALVNHDPSKVIGRTRAATMMLRKDARGLHVLIYPPETTVGRDILESVRRGDITGMSFRFQTLKDEWRTDERYMPIRSVLDMHIQEVSIVAFPAYAATDAHVAQRSLEGFRRERALDRVRPQRIDWLQRRLAQSRRVR